MKHIVYVLGVTCTGKTTVIKEIEQKFIGVRSVLIGQELRKKYPPEFFRGMGAMPETEEEVIRILRDAIEDFLTSDDELLLVDGAPRLPPCFDFCESVSVYRCDRSYLLLVVDSDSVLDSRSRDRDGDNVEKLALSQQRISTDKQLTYEILCSILKEDLSDSLIVLNTTDGFDDDTIEQLVRAVGGPGQLRKRDPDCQSCVGTPTKIADRWND